MIRVNRGHWESKKNRELFGVYLGKELKYETMEDWYKITSQSIKQNKGGGLLKKYYNNSPIIFCKNIFPEYKWLDWKFKNISHGYWDSVENRKNYATWLGEILGYRNMEDWYNIKTQQIQNNYGGSLMVLKYNSSIIKFLRDVFPEYEWLEWKLTITTKGYWEIIENHSKFANWLGKELKFNKMEDWYNITYDVIYKNGGSVLLNKYYNHSPIIFCKAIFPEYEWLGWKFTSAPNNFWDNEENIKNYAIWLGKTLGYNKMEDWYNLDTNIMSENHGIGLIKHYKLIDFMKKVFPDYEWFEWKFGMASNGYWKNKENHKKYANWLFAALQYNHIEDWYNINKYLIENNCGGGLLSNYYNNSPALFVCSIFPEYDWDLSKFTKYYSKGQIEWLDYISVSRPDIIHILNNNEGEFKIPNSKYKADGYCATHKEVYEYHGDFWHGNPEIYNENDFNPKTLTTFGELHKKTINKRIFIENSGYKYFAIYESKWIKAKKCVVILQNKFRKK